MAKVLCMFALAGLAVGAPSAQLSRASSQVDQESILASILSSIQPSIDAAIASALGESKTVTVTKLVKPAVVGTVSTTYSTESNANSVGSGNVAQQAGASYSTSVQRNNYKARQQTVAPGIVQVLRPRPTGFAGISNTNQAKEVVTVTSGNAGNANVYSATAQNVHLGVAPKRIQEERKEVVTTTTYSNNNEQQLAQNVMSALVPSIEAAVRAALAKQESTTTVTSSVSQDNQVNSGVTTQVTEVNTGSTFGPNDLLQSVMSALLPQIQQAVNSAYQQSVTTTTVTANQVNEVPATVSTVNTVQQQQVDANEALVLRVVEALRPSISSTVRDVLNVETSQTVVQAPVVVNTQAVSNEASQASVSSTSTSTAAEQSSFDYNTLISQIITSLKPSVELSVQNALNALSASSQNQQTSTVTTQVSEVQQTSSAVESSNDDQTLIKRIIAILTPSISSTVQNVLASQQTLTEVVSYAPVSTVQTTSVVNNQAANLANNQASTSVSTNVQESTFNKNDIIAQIVASLKPSIASSVQSVLSSTGASSSQAVNTQTSEITTVNTSSNQQSASSNVNSGASRTSLQSIFGDGSALNVKFDAPAYHVEYSN